ncbi:hypothetical protein B9479_005327 [Cryptococcus floricola]|uniref:Integrase catalytic domain-containing protein n=1 Tax=Cryptococcus floricola TaxID=2591691 RepID=A0A5D3AV04_9TREE|nr:hypothetical protein B9479_005327 [Cryptococcus floricola]
MKSLPSFVTARGRGKVNAVPAAVITPVASWDLAGEVAGPFCDVRRVVRILPTFTKSEMVAKMAATAYLWAENVPTSEIDFRINGGNIVGETDLMWIWGQKAGHGTNTAMSGSLWNPDTASTPAGKGPLDGSSLRKICRAIENTAGLGYHTLDPATATVQFVDVTGLTTEISTRYPRRSPLAKYSISVTPLDVPTLGCYVRAYKAHNLALAGKLEDDSGEQADLFINHVFSRFGLPDSIVSDRGPTMVSNLWRALCERLLIQQRVSTAYHPQTSRAPRNGWVVSTVSGVSLTNVEDEHPVISTILGQGDGRQGRMKSSSQSLKGLTVGLRFRRRPWPKAFVRTPSGGALPVSFHSLGALPDTAILTCSFGLAGYLMSGDSKAGFERPPADVAMATIDKGYRNKSFNGNRKRGQNPPGKRRSSNHDKPTPPKFDGECFYCHKKGHRIDECRKKKASDATRDVANKGSRKDYRRTH